MSTEFSSPVPPEMEALPAPLMQWYQAFQRPLPWRQTRDPYKIWLSEIMLQQTRISAALDYYTRFTAALPDIPSLAACPEDLLMKLWQGLGYYSRARNLQKAARILVDRYGGLFPRDYEAIRALPGIGDYTAGAVGSIAFGLAVPAVDGNVMRVLTRLLADGRDISEEKAKAYFRSLLCPVIPREDPGKFNQALMELGERICLPSGAPLCGECPLRGFCRAHAAGREEDYPVRQAKKPRRVEERTVWLLFYQNRVALRRRPEKGLLAGLWELPNHLKGQAFPLPPLDDRPVKAAQGKHVFSHIEWHMEAYAAHLSSPDLPEGWVWAGEEELEKNYALPSAFRFVLPVLGQELRP